MARDAIESYLYLMDAGFDGPYWHSLASNLNSVAPEDWEWIPPGGARPIRKIVQHVGLAKVVACNQAFGGGTITWDDPGVDADEMTVDVPTAIAWLRTSQERLRSGVAALSDDAELLRQRRTNWGELWETRLIIVVTMIQ